METEDMFGTIRKVISFVTLVTTLIIAVRELKIAVDGFRKSGRSTNNNSKTASNRA
jgi:hypothetical protein